MENPIDVYVKGVYNRFGYFGTWLPNSPITLGDLGLKKGCSFRRISSLKKLKIPFQTRKGTSSRKFHYASHSQLHAGIGSEVEGAGIAADVIIDLECEGAFVFQAENCIQHEIEDKAAVARAVADALGRNEWDLNWSVVDAVVYADSATILIANSNGARVELSAATHLPEIMESLADLRLGLHVRAQPGDVTRFLAERGLTPLFRLSRPRVPLLMRLFSTAKEHSVLFGGPGRLPIQGAPSENELWELLSPD
jgi:hypothetical protein